MNGFEYFFLFPLFSSSYSYWRREILTARRLKHSALISDLLGPKQRIDFANLSLTEVNILTELERAYLEYRSRFTHALWNWLRKASLSPKIKEGSRKPYKEYRLWTGPGVVSWEGSLYWIDHRKKKDRNGIGCLSRKIRCFERRIGFC